MVFKNKQDFKKFWPLVVSHPPLCDTPIVAHTTMWCHWGGYLNVYVLIYFFAGWICWPLLFNVPNLSRDHPNLVSKFIPFAVLLLPGLTQAMRNRGYVQFPCSTVCWPFATEGTIMDPEARGSCIVFPKKALFKYGVHSTLLPRKNYHESKKRFVSLCVFPPLIPKPNEYP